MNYTGAFFIVLKACVGPVTLFGWVDNRRTVSYKFYQQNLSVFEFRVFSFSLSDCLTRYNSRVKSPDCWFNSGVKRWIHVSSVVTYLCKNSFLLHWNSCKQCTELSKCCFWSTVSKCATHFEHSFLIDKCSYKIVNTLLSDIFKSSAFSCNFNLWSAKMSLWSFWCFPGQLPNLGDLSVQHHLCLNNRI